MLRERDEKRKWKQRLDIILLLLVQIIQLSKIYDVDLR
jgi:hypothetical protein